MTEAHAKERYRLLLQACNELWSPGLQSRLGWSVGMPVEVGRPAYCGWYHSLGR